MVKVKIAHATIEADVCWSNVNEYRRFTSEKQERVVKETVKIVAPECNLKWLIEDYQKKESKAEYGTPEKVGVRIYESDIVIGEQEPLGYYEEWELDGEHSITLTKEIAKNTNA